MNHPCKGRRSNGSTNGMSYLAKSLFKASSDFHTLIIAIRAEMNTTMAGGDNLCSDLIAMNCNYVVRVRGMSQENYRKELNPCGESLTFRYV